MLLSLLLKHSQIPLLSAFGAKGNILIVDGGIVATWILFNIPSNYTSTKNPTESWRVQYINTGELCKKRIFQYHKKKEILQWFGIWPLEVIIISPINDSRKEAAGRRKTPNIVLYN